LKGRKLLDSNSFAHSSKPTQQKKTGRRGTTGVAQVGECLPNKYKVLSTNPSTGGKKRRRRRRQDKTRKK
jgi:hypothetical protein